MSLNSVRMGVGQCPSLRSYRKGNVKTGRRDSVREKDSSACRTQNWKKTKESQLAKDSKSDVLDRLRSQRSYSSPVRLVVARFSVF